MTPTPIRMRGRVPERSGNLEVTHRAPSGRPARVQVWVPIFSSEVARDEQDVECPGCGGSMVYIERGTGEMMMASWDPETFDPDEYKLSETYERVERYQICERCGWRVDL